MEVCSRIIVRDNGVTVRWVLAHHGIDSNEKADEYAKAAAEESAPCDDVPDEHRWEANLSHMVRAVAEARSHATAEWISSHALYAYEPGGDIGPHKDEAFEERNSAARGSLWPAATTGSSRGARW